MTCIARYGAPVHAHLHTTFFGAGELTNGHPCRLLESVELRCFERYNSNSHQDAVSSTGPHLLLHPHLCHKASQGRLRAAGNE